MVLILLVACGTGLAAALLARLALDAVGRLELEKRLWNGFGAVRRIRPEGLAGTLLFLAEKTGRLLERPSPAALVALRQEVARDLAILGGTYRDISPSAFLGGQLIAGAALAAFCALMLWSVNPLFLAAAGVLGWFLPLLWLRERVKMKHRAVFRELPDTLDLLTIMMEAGLDFSGALERITDREDGVVAGELRIARREMTLGASRTEALERMAARIDFQPLRNVTGSLVLSLKTGGSLAPTLRALSRQLRTERAQLAEKMAGEAPIKLMLPLILLIFPTIFIILFGPIVLSFIGGNSW